MSKKKSVNPDESKTVFDESAQISEEVFTSIKEVVADKLASSVLTPSEKRKKELEEYIKAGGRPTVYKEEYPQMLLEHMKQGLSFRSFAAVAGVDFDTVYRWASEHKEFYDAKRAGEAYALMFDEKVLNGISMGAYGKSASAASHIFKMKNCHKWTDKVEVEQTNKNIEIKIDSTDAQL